MPPGKPWRPPSCGGLRGRRMQTWLAQPDGTLDPNKDIHVVLHSGGDGHRD